MQDWICDWICELTGATAAQKLASLQALWSGYGELYRVGLTGTQLQSVIVKAVHPPNVQQHPRGWNSDRSHARKLHSYQNELEWYRAWSGLCHNGCKVPQYIGSTETASGQIIVLEDLDRSGYSERRHDCTPAEINACLQWLANFHALFMGQAPGALWPVGTYWHLATRPDELAATPDPHLVRVAPLLDARLNSARFKTLVHGDAKVANFCFHPSVAKVAAVDFQYVGSGCGMKDVAYFLSSVLSSEELFKDESIYLNRYFGYLRLAAAAQVTPVELADLEAEWRALYPLAWADFDRFLAGWAPQHWKRHAYSRSITARVLQEFVPVDP